MLIARAVVPRREAHALGWLVQLLPIAFVFRIRANQEYAVLAGVLFALYACERTRARPWWMAGMLGGFVAVLLVKGVFAFMVPLTCAAWLLARGSVSHVEQGPANVEQGAVNVEQGADNVEQGADNVEQGFSPADHPVEQGFSPARSYAAWTAILLMPVAGALVTWAYESTYVHVTGRSFLEIYRARQVPEGALTSGSPVMRTIYTLVWYTGRVIWFAFPWSVFAAASLAGTRRAKSLWPPRIGSPLADRGVPPHAENRGAERAALEQSNISMRQGAWFAAVATAALVAAFSLAHRKADRYNFPAYSRPPRSAACTRSAEFRGSAARPPRSIGRGSRRPCTSHWSCCDWPPAARFPNSRSGGHRRGFAQD